MRSKRIGAISRILKYGFLVLVCLVFGFPLYWTLNISLQPEIEALAFPPKLYPFPADFSVYVNLLAGKKLDINILKLGFNSAVTTLISLAVILPVAILASYSLSRFRYRGRKQLLLLVLGMRMLPPIVLVIPLFFVLRTYRLSDSQLGLGITYSAMIVPIVIWLLVGYMEQVPRGIEDAARIDGCNRWGVLWRIMVPTILPGLIAATILSAIMAWSDFLMAVVLTSMNATTLPVAIPFFMTEVSFDFRQLCAYGIMVSVPMLIMGLWLSSYLIKGLTVGGMKQ